MPVFWVDSNNVAVFFFVFPVRNRVIQPIRVDDFDVRVTGGLTDFGSAGLGEGLVMVREGMGIRG